MTPRNPRNYKLNAEVSETGCISDHVIGDGFWQVANTAKDRSSASSIFAQSGHLNGTKP